MKSRTVTPELLFLEGPFTKIAKAMSKNFNIRVIPSGFACATNGSEVFIPFNADYLPESKRQLLNGMMDHEVGHVIEEREAVEYGRKRPLELMESEKNTTIRMLFNAFEDVRIEMKFSLRWPGVAENLRALNEESVHQFLAKGEPIGHFWHQIACYVIMASRGLSTDWITGRAAEKAPLLAEELEASKKTVWADDCLALARRTYELLKTDLDKEKSEKESGEEKGKGIGVALPGEKSASDPADSEDETGAEVVVRVDSEGAVTGSKPEATVGEEPDPEIEESTVSDIIDVLKRDLATHAKMTAIATEAYVPNPLLRRHDRFTKPSGSDARAQEKYNKAKADVERQIGVMRAKQLAYFQTISRRKVVGGLEEGQLEDSEITSIRFGNRAVFNDARRGRMLDTATEVLLDLSGSMGDNNNPGDAAYWAFRTAIALAESWESLRMPYEIMGFDNVGGVIGAEFGSGFVGRPAFNYPIFKGWDERLANCRGRFSSIRGGSQNADGEAVMAAAQRLSRRREARRILVVVSDGEPACPGIEHGKNAAYLKKVVRDVSRAGFEVIGIGANSTAVTHYYNKSTGASNLVINDLSNLARDVFGHLHARIVGAA